ncbi:MAG: thioredoxin family protein [Candidatus Aminicenantes bacterium]|nr:thioredoxin family protein [Candidatus Aminicenantes bacterium]
MKKIFVSLLILLFSTSFCSKNSREPFEDLKAEEAVTNGENLIVSDEDLTFSKHKVTFIELGADRCIPCKAMQPVMREIAQEYRGTIQVVFYDVWKTPKYSNDYGIQLIPTQVFIDENGKEIFRHVGFFAKEDILKMLKEKRVL